MTASLQVANTILEQLGAKRFIAMTGARNFVGSDNCLAFRIPRIQGISQVRITLTAMDDYTVQFIGMGHNQLVVKSEHSGIYADQLQALFTAQTGLHTRL